MSVYKLTGKLLDLQDHADEIDTTTFDDTADSIKLNLGSEYDDVMNLITNLKSDVDGIDSEKKRLTLRKNAINKNIAYLRNIIAQSINASGQTKVKTASHTYSVPGTFKYEVVVNKDTLPSSYFVMKPQADNALIKEDLLKGKVVGDGKLVKSLRMTIR